MGFNMDLTNFHEDWVKIVEKGCEDYSSLTPPERVWFNVQSLIGQVGNGGLVSYYYNSYADHVFETIDDLLTLGKKDIAHLLEEMNALFPGCDIAKDFDGRNEIISSWNERHDQLLKELDDEFFQKDDELEKVLVEYILRNNLTSCQSQKIGESD
jgi:hypothetical protein